VDKQGVAVNAEKAPNSPNLVAKGRRWH